MTDAEEAPVTETVRGLGGATQKVRDHMVGPSLGRELRQGALIALAVALGAQLLYLAARFRWVFSTAAVTALAHDVLILVGVSSATRSTTPSSSSSASGNAGAREPGPASRT